MSLRLRISVWNAGVIGLTLAALTLATAYQERRRLVRIESAHARALLEHLTLMPEFQGDRETAVSRLALMQESLRAAGGGLELAPRRSGGPEADEGVATHRALAVRELDLGGRAYELRYLADEERLAGMLRRSLWMHVLYGLTALTAGTGGWTYPIAAAKRCKEVCLRVAEELRHQYLLGYSATNHERDGRWRTIEVRTTRPGVTLATRSGYYAEGAQ